MVQVVHSYQAPHHGTKGKLIPGTSSWHKWYTHTRPLIMAQRVKSYQPLTMAQVVHSYQAPHRGTSGTLIPSPYPWHKWYTHNRPLTMTHVVYSYQNTHHGTSGTPHTRPLTMVLFVCLEELIRFLVYYCIM